LPKAGAEPLDPELLKNETPLVLSIDRAGLMYLNEGSNPKQPLDDETVEVRTAAALRRRPNRPVLMKADYRIEYGRVMSAMVILQRAGARKVGFVSDPLPERKSRS
jgi:biopolymer transport protein TolR